jgi:hypothetical protein
MPVGGDDQRIPERSDPLQGVGVQEEEIGLEAFGDGARSVRHAQQLGGAGRGGLERVVAAWSA